MSIPIRQPLPSMTIWIEYEELKRFRKDIKQWEKMLKDEMNVKKIYWGTKFKEHNIIVEF